MEKFRAVVLAANGERLGDKFPEAFRRRVEQAEQSRAEQDQQIVEGTLWQGPRAMARLSDEQLAGCIKSTALRRWSESYQPEDGNKLIVGPTDIGKTAACVRVVRRLVLAKRSAALHKAYTTGNRVDALVRGPSTCWARAIDLAIARQQHPLGQGEAEAIRDAEEAGLLVLDDLGWEGVGKSDPLVQILVHRYDLSRPMIVTSGYPVADLEARYGAALLRRVLQVGGQQSRVLDLFAEQKPVVRAVGGR